jgi:hypothetical protein
VTVAAELGDDLSLALNVPFALGDMPLGHRQMLQEHGPVHTSD